MKKILIITIFLNILITFSINSAKSIELDSEEQEEIAKLDAMYSNFKTIRSKFIQTDSLGNHAQGWFIISKPGKARIEYENIPVRLIANNNTLLFEDIKLKQKTFIPISSYPFSFLLESDTSIINKNVEIKDFKKHDDYSEITLVSSKNPELGKITIYLQNNTGELMRWKVIDANNITTDIFLVDPELSTDSIKNNKIFNTQRILEIDYNSIK